jgi:hypothetical protein
LTLGGSFRIRGSQTEDIMTTETTEFETFLTEHNARRRLITTEELTGKQKLTAEAFIDGVKRARARTGGTDVKQLEIARYGDDSYVFITITTGLPNDEGTYASVFARDYRHVMVGAKGGITLLNAKTVVKNRGLFNAIHALTK